MNNPHTIGFKKEALFHHVLGELAKQYPGFKARTLKKIIACLAPDFLDGLFVRKPCRRYLKYIGLRNLACAPTKRDPFHIFEIGKTYKCISFNGATYRFRGYERCIGYIYFEVELKS